MNNMKISLIVSPSSFKEPSWIIIIIMEEEAVVTTIEVEEDIEVEQVGKGMVTEEEKITITMAEVETK